MTEHGSVDEERGRVIQRYPFADGYLALAWEGPLLDERVMEEFAFFAERHGAGPVELPPDEEVDAVVDDEDDEDEPPCPGCLLVVASESQEVTR